MQTHTERVRAALAERIGSFPLINGNTADLHQPWGLPHLTEVQQHERALIEARMRAGKLRGLPTVFGDLT